MSSGAEQRGMLRDVHKLVGIQTNEAKIWLFIVLSVLGFACAPLLFGVIAAFVMFVLKLVFPLLAV
jgi:hypothetical protein